MNRLIQWFVENRVAANLLMLFIFIGGFASLGHLDKEVFPMVARNIIEGLGGTISVDTSPGLTSIDIVRPTDVEEPNHEPVEPDDRTR